MVPNKKKIKKNMLSKYQIRISDVYNITFGNIKILVPNFFWQRKTCALSWELTALSEVRFNQKKHRVLEFNQPQRLKP